MAIHIKEYEMGNKYSTRMEDDIDGRLIFIFFTSPPIRNQSMHYICIHEKMQASNVFRPLFERPSFVFWWN